LINDKYLLFNKLFDGNVARSGGHSACRRAVASRPAERRANTVETWIFPQPPRIQTLNLDGKMPALYVRRDACCYTAPSWLACFVLPGGLCWNAVKQPFINVEEKIDCFAGRRTKMPDALSTVTSNKANAIAWR
jgi:hypothetical protein